MHFRHQKFENVQVVYPVHMNLYAEPVMNFVIGEKYSRLNQLNITIYDSFTVTFLTIWWYSRRSEFKKASPRLRETTERPEALKAGTVRLVGTNEAVILDEVTNLMIDQKRYEMMAQAKNPYGDGMAAGRICEILAQ